MVKKIMSLLPFSFLFIVVFISCDNPISISSIKLPNGTLITQEEQSRIKELEPEVFSLLADKIGYTNARTMARGDGVEISEEKLDSFLIDFRILMEDRVGPDYTKYIITQDRWESNAFSSRAYGDGPLGSGLAYFISCPNVWDGGRLKGHVDIYLYAWNRYMWTPFYTYNYVQCSFRELQSWDWKFVDSNILFTLSMSDCVTTLKSKTATQHLTLDGDWLWALWPAGPPSGLKWTLQTYGGFGTYHYP